MSGTHRLQREMRCNPVESEKISSKSRLDSRFFENLLNS